MSVLSEAKVMDLACTNDSYSVATASLKLEPIFYFFSSIGRSRGLAFERSEIS
jgi:hypothetical protein